MEVVLTCATTVLPAAEVTRKLSQPDAVAAIAKQLEALLYPSKGSTLV